MVQQSSVDSIFVPLARVRPSWGNPTGKKPILEVAEEKYIPVMSDLKWMGEVLREPNAANALNEDLQDVLAIAGLEKFVQLFETFNKTSVYFSNDCVNALRRLYIRKHSADDLSKIARTLGTSEVYARRIRRLK